MSERVVGKTCKEPLCWDQPLTVYRRKSSPEIKTHPWPHRQWEQMPLLPLPTLCRDPRPSSESACPRGCAAAGTHASLMSEQMWGRGGVLYHQ